MALTAFRGGGIKGEGFIVDAAMGPVSLRHLRLGQIPAFLHCQSAAASAMNDCHRRAYQQGARERA
jgi:hypothetical protein